MQFCSSILCIMSYGSINILWYNESSMTYMKSWEGLRMMPNTVNCITILVPIKLLVSLFMLSPLFLEWLHLWTCWLVSRSVPSPHLRAGHSWRFLDGPLCHAWPTPASMPWSALHTDKLVAVGDKNTWNTTSDIFMCVRNYVLYIGTVTYGTIKIFFQPALDLHNLHNIIMIKKHCHFSTHSRVVVYVLNRVVGHVHHPSGKTKGRDLWKSKSKNQKAHFQHSTDLLNSYHCLTLQSCMQYKLIKHYKRCRKESSKQVHVCIISQWCNW